MARWIQNILLVVACLCVGFTIYTLLWGNNNGNGTDTIRADLQRIEAQQRDIVKRLDTISKGLDTSIVITQGIASRVGEVAGLVESVEGRIGASTARIEASQQRITEGQRVIQGIREREQTKVK